MTETVTDLPKRKLSAVSTANAVVYLIVAGCLLTSLAIVVVGS